MVVLRDYQLSAAGLAEAAMAAHGATLVVMATGMGKTVVFGEVIRRYASRGLASLMCVHREELVTQGAARILADTGIEPAIEMADAYSPEGGFRPPMCVVGSVQSLSRPGRLARFPRGRFGLVVIDEAHHVAAASYGAVLDHFAPAHHLGVTATPRRGDGAALGPRMKSLACEYGIEWGVAYGWLVPVRQLIVKVDGLDFARVKVTAGDWSAGELDEILSAEGPLHAMARPIAEEAGREQVIVFCAGVKQAAALSAVLNRYRTGFSNWLCGDVKKTHPDDRKAMVAAFKSGTLQCLVNVGVLTEGFDHAPTGLVVVARPTRSLGLYCQMLGRATRPLKGVVDGPPDAASRLAAIRSSAKPSCRILDFVGASSRHSLKQVTAADALGGDIDHKVKAHARQNMESAPLPGADVAREIERARAEMELLAEEEERRKRITAEVEYRLEDGGGAGHAIANVATPRGVIVEPATPGQVWKLRGLGFDHEKAKRLSKKQAIGVIGRLLRERAMNGRAA